MNRREEAAARRDYRAGLNAPEQARHRRRGSGGRCKKSKDGQHRWVAGTKNWAGTSELPIDRCANCGKESWTQKTTKAFWDEVSR